MSIGGNCYGNLYWIFAVDTHFVNRLFRLALEKATKETTTLEVEGEKVGNFRCGLCGNYGGK